MKKPDYVFSVPTESIPVVYCRCRDNDPTERKALLCYYRQEGCIRVLDKSGTKYIDEPTWDEPCGPVDDLLWADLKDDLARYNNDISILLFG